MLPACPVFEKGKGLEYSEMTKISDNSMTSENIIHAAFKAYIENTVDMVFVKDIHLHYVAASVPFVQMVGKNREEEIIGRSDFEIFEDTELAKRYTDDDKKLLAADRSLLNYVEPLADDQGHPRYSSTSKYILRDEKGEAIGILGMSRDITREYLARQRYQQELTYLFELPSDTYAALFMDIDDWRIIRHQRHTVGENVLEICETMESFAQNALDCLVDPGDMVTRQFYKTLSKETLLEICDVGKRQFSLEYLRRMPNGEPVWVRTDINFMIDPENSHLCAIWSMKNIDSQRQETMNLIHAAEYDEMTGILNRASTIKYIEQTLETRSHECHALFAIDVDNFKSLNDNFGHQTGDEFLISLSKAIKACFRESDVIGRMGGDEFFVLMKNVPDRLIVSEKAETLLRIGRSICAAYANLNITLSIGISMFPMNGRNLDELYASADGSLYQAKNQGKNRMIFAQDQHLL